jgi:CheY-like chemotaxis protein
MLMNVQAEPSTGQYPVVQQPPAVLVIDDEADLRDGVAFWLEQNGYPVVTASNGEEGLALLRSGLRPSLVLLDLMMPIRDGFGFRQAQLQDPLCADIPVVVFSGVYDPRAHSAALRAAAYLQKPVDLDQLLGLVRQYCS